MIYYIIALCFDSIVSYNTSVQNNISAVMKRRQQNQKFSFHFLSGSPHTPRRKRIGKEIFGFVGRPEGARGAQSLHALRAYDFGQTHHAVGAWIIPQNPADFARNSFELCPTNTAPQTKNSNDIAVFCLRCGDAGIRTLEPFYGLPR